MGICASSYYTISLGGIKAYDRRVKKNIKSGIDQHTYNNILQSVPLRLNFRIIGENRVVESDKFKYNATHSYEYYMTLDNKYNKLKICVNKKIGDNLLKLYEGKRCGQCDEIWCICI